MTLTILPNRVYPVVVFIGFTVYGIGLGFYATPSTDTVVDNVPAVKAGFLNCVKLTKSSKYKLKK
ncbi:MAG TPA: hypothetical protein VEY51_21050 [Chondromyces sp.]|nr:hypothetical protein [Chondromyces sp.]